MKNILSILLLSLVVLSNGCIRQTPPGLTIIDGVLSVGVEVGYPPMEYYDTDGVTLLGFDIELAKALAQNLGLKVNFIDTAWEGILAGLESDRYDIAVNITIIPERQKRFNFTKPYIDSSITIVALKDSSINIEKPEDIAGYRVAYQGDTTAQYFTERIKENVSSVVPGSAFTAFSYDKIIYCFDELKFGRIDLVVVDNIAAFEYTGKENSPFEVIWQGVPDEYIAICLKKGNDALSTALNNALDELYLDGTLLKIYQQIFGHGLSEAMLELY
ncbi:MAG: ABC transporter substrate-binding protein [Treponema sp.]|nr:ABC transporter substrate-binding protein [Treponema sp.]